MKAHHSFAFLIHRLMYTDKDAETEIIRLDTPCVEKMMDVLRSCVKGAAHGDDGLVQGSGQHRRPMTAAGARSQKKPGERLYLALERPGCRRSPGCLLRARPSRPQAPAPGPASPNGHHF